MTGPNCTRALPAAASLAAALVLAAALGAAGPAGADTITSSPPAPTAGQSYLLSSADGTVRAYGETAATGNAAINPAHPVVGLAASPSGKGWWMVGQDGGVFAEGDAAFFGSTGAMKLNKPVVGMAASPSGKGYWFVASDGGIFSFGDAAFHGSTGAMRLNKPVVGMATTPSGKGYWLVASDGGIFAFGDAAFYGSTGAMRLNQPIVGMAATPGGKGYRFVAADGGIFSFGDAHFYGSSATSAPAAAAAAPVRGLAATATGLGYWVVDAAGGVRAFGDAKPAGAPNAVSSPIAGIARLPVPPGAASTAVSFALSHVGDPYVYGAAGPTQWDCSGLTMVAYQKAGLIIPRVAQDQFDFGPRLPAGATLAPGDLLFFGSSPTAVGHVGMYVGNGEMVDAPHTGAYVEVTSFAARTDFQGATRPTGL